MTKFDGELNRSAYSPDRPFALFVVRLPIIPDVETSSKKSEQTKRYHTIKDCGNPARHIENNIAELPNSFKRVYKNTQSLFGRYKSQYSNYVNNWKIFNKTYSMKMWHS